MLAANPAYWAEHSPIKLQKGYWSFDKRRYLLEPMSSTARKKAYMKATQGGFTELEVNSSMHGMIHGRYPRGVLYLFPTANDIGAFSQSRFGPLIDANPRTIGRFVKSTNSTHLKQVGDAFLYLRGGTLPKTLDFNAREAAALRGIAVDKVVYDEEDIMDPECVMKARQRMGDSTIKEEVHISNPTIPGYGIDKHFQESDQRYWFRQCDCGYHFSAVLEFPGCVKYRKDGTGYVACPKCGRETFADSGSWVPQNKEASDRLHGYQWSQLDSYQNDPGEILEEYTDPPEGNLGDVVRLRIGLPYVAAEDRLTQAEVLACCSDTGQLSSHAGPCAMGIDCQKPKRIVIGARTGRESYSIFRVLGHADSSWDKVYDLVRKFNIKSTVIDIRPYEDAARQCQRKLRRMGVSTYLCEYSDSTPLGWQFNNRTGIAKVNRTEILDLSHRTVTTPGQLVLPRRCPEILEFAKQMCNTAKVYDARAGIYRYRKLAADDYRHALNYFLLAASSGRVGMASMAYRQARQTHATDSSRDGYVRPDMQRAGRLSHAIG
jgi:hypothetical protein